jgi:hypothetical protein
MREPIREPTPQEERPGRAPEPLRYVGPGVAPTAAPFALGGLTEWAPTWGGVFVTLGVFLLLSSLGVAIGVSTGTTGVVIWEAISVIVAFFIGCWFTGRTLSMIDPLIAAAHGVLVWAVAIVFTLVFFIITSVAGISALANVARVPFIADLLRFIGATPPTAAPTAPAGAAVTSAWVTFIFLLLSVIAAVIGGLVGNQARLGEISEARER